MGRLDKKGKKMIRYCRYLFLLLFILCSVSSFAHVNSPDVSYQGKAGNYDVLVNVNPPDVIPGVATISIYIEHYNGEQVTVETQYYFAGKKGAGAPEIAKPVNGSAGWLEAEQWFMTYGTLNVHIKITGSKGTGEVNVPVMGVDTAHRKMTLGLGILLVGMGVLLIVLIISIIGSSVSDALAKAGADRRKLRRKKFIGMGVMSVIILIVLFFVYRWCKNDHLTYLAYLYKPIKGHSEVFDVNGRYVLRLQVTDTAQMKFGHEPLSYVVPDHGKLMHLALAKVNTLDAFAHLHPIRQDANTYLVNLPDLPTGQYFLYGDVVSWNGFAETIIDTLNITAKPRINDSLKNILIATSADDAWLISEPIMHNVSNKPVTICGVTGTSFKLQDGSTAVWEHDPGQPVKAKRFFSLKFDIIGPDNKPADLQPYMGMMGHAIVVKDDGVVYAHLHPIGSFAMASQQQVDKRMNNNRMVIAHLPDPKKYKDSIDKVIAHIDSMTEAQRNAYLSAEMGGSMDMGMDKMNMSVVQFPYTFPSAGRYRVWMEVKVNNRILTADFDVNVVN
jgi:hypothetical protein